METQRPRHTAIVKVQVRGFPFVIYGGGITHKGKARVPGTHTGINLIRLGIRERREPGKQATHTSARVRRDSVKASKHIRGVSPRGFATKSTKTYPCSNGTRGQLSRGKTETSTQVHQLRIVRKTKTGKDLSYIQYGLFRVS